jgi:hypothetical protein
MTRRIVTDEKMGRRRRRAAAVSRLWDAIISSSEDHGEMDPFDWLMALNEVQGRILAIALRGETGEDDLATEG